MARLCQYSSKANGLHSFMHKDGNSYHHSYHFSGEELFLAMGKNKGGTLHSHYLNKENSRQLRDLAPIRNFEVVPPGHQNVVYLTADNRLKMVDTSIKQEKLEGYYRHILPPLSQEEKEKYGISVQSQD